MNIKKILIFLVVAQNVLFAQHSFFLDEYDQFADQFADDSYSYENFANDNDSRDYRSLHYTDGINDKNVSETYYKSQIEENPNSTYYKDALDISQNDCGVNTFIVNRLLEKGIKEAQESGTLKYNMTIVREVLANRLAYYDSLSRKQGKIGDDGNVMGQVIDSYHKKAFKDVGINPKFYGNEYYKSKYFDPEFSTFNPVPLDYRYLPDDMPPLERYFMIINSHKNDYTAYKGKKVQFPRDWTLEKKREYLSNKYGKQLDAAALLETLHDLEKVQFYRDWTLEKKREYPIDEYSKQLKAELLEALYDLEKQKENDLYSTKNNKSSKEDITEGKVWPGYSKYNNYKDSGYNDIRDKVLMKGFYDKDRNESRYDKNNDLDKMMSKYPASVREDEFFKVLEKQKENDRYGTKNNEPSKNNDLDKMMSKYPASAREDEFFKVLEKQKENDRYGTKNNKSSKEDIKKGNHSSNSSNGNNSNEKYSRDFGREQKSFKESFRDARSQGKENFTWNGKEYNTKLK